jgi:hypothetical protein
MPDPDSLVSDMDPDPSIIKQKIISVADPGAGAFLTPGSGIRNRFIPDLGSRIPNPYFLGLGDNFFNFLGKNFNNSWKIGPNFFSSAYQK